MPRGVVGPVEKPAHKQSGKGRNNAFPFRDELGRFKVGNPVKGGRPKGSKNKFSGEVKRAILDGIHSAHPHGLEAWVELLAEMYPTSAAALLGRLIPVSTENKVDVTHEVTVTFK